MPSCLLKLAILKILVSEPCTGPFPQLRGHRPDQGVGPFAFEEGPARHNVHATLATREHDIGSARVGQEAKPFGADHGDDDDVVFVTCFRRVSCERLGPEARWGQDTDLGRNRH